MPTIYGVEHVTYLIIVISLMILTTWFIKRHIKTEKQLRLIIRVIGILLLIAITWNRISVSMLRSGFDEILPGTFCGTSSLFLAISAITLKKNHVVFHTLIYVGLLGGLLTLFYPEFIGQGATFFYPMTISAMIHHTLMVYLALLMLFTGYVKPALKHWIILPIGLSFYMIYGLFLITELNYNDAMYIYHPILEGTPLNWFVLGMLFLIVHVIFLWVWDKKLFNWIPFLENNINNNGGQSHVS
ncbi:MAG: hypothetical protein A2Y45_07035 [Tenericutes bacterium GWC2_34_14]|nr:MAG: hypothetical protein A2Y45_07035 [Tenericutes bacterium GWC2_34_14]OHE33377.1 MAG: hypothetical protein A2012_10305 [Tenericutes bacterium GWE2_34_108]OHE36678.1 MAG: hypothetical protein A2Y46_08580 [Tenericutes bacterium GWF1_35_14]OHE38242.1 MAG: hypothetical protein A2Y44_10085 [Tenericutes bacterium GWF2_35_184]OHE44949.1 MAG: hypothetical protein A2221_04995 [Tenericutes bacterium RIFOXYA2_FULL_36_32]OHE45008.1 MAG: hypothetical protein A3K26_10035 [Tenericutes bacterium RIFOXYA1